MNMTAKTALEVIEGMKRDGMLAKTQKKFLEFALKMRGHMFPADAVKIYKDRINEIK